MESRLQLIVEVPSVPSAELDQALEIARELGLDLESQHPGSQDADLQRFFAAPVSDLEIGQRAVERLSALQGVRAYVKPPASLA
jgi:hypothetical protein